MWYDPRHPKGPLLEAYRPRVVYDSGLSFNAKLSKVIHGDDRF